MLLGSMSGCCHAGQEEHRDGAFHTYECVHFKDTHWLLATKNTNSFKLNMRQQIHRIPFFL